jgi:putative transposase
MTGETAGLDFGLKTFFTDATGHPYRLPEFLRQNLAVIKAQSKRVSKKQKGSKRKAKAQYQLSRTQIRVTDKRENSHYQLAHELCDKFDTIYIETLYVGAMQKLWGRKVSDLGFAKFVTILEWVALKRGVVIVFIGRFEATSKTCSRCGHVKDMPLSERQYECNHCGLVIDRDHNAAKNIKRIGASIQLPEVCQTVSDTA